MSNVTINRELRALIAAGQSVRYDAPSIADGPALDPSPTAAPDRMAPNPFEAMRAAYSLIRLRRDGARPLAFQGALGVTLRSPNARRSSARSATGRIGHRLDLYLSEGGPVVAHLVAARLSDDEDFENAADALFAAQVVEDRTGLVAFLNAYSPDALASAPQALWASDIDVDAMSQAQSAYEAQRAAAHADFQALRASPLLLASAEKVDQRLN